MVSVRGATASSRAHLQSCSHEPGRTQSDADLRRIRGRALQSDLWHVLRPGIKRDAVRCPEGDISIRTTARSTAPTIDTESRRPGPHRARLSRHSLCSAHGQDFPALSRQRRRETGPFGRRRILHDHTAIRRRAEEQQHHSAVKRSPELGPTLPLVEKSRAGVMFGSRPWTHALEGRLQGCSSRDTMTTEQKRIRASDALERTPWLGISNSDSTIRARAI